MEIKHTAEWEDLFKSIVIGYITRFGYYDDAYKDYLITQSSIMTDKTMAELTKRRQTLEADQGKYR